MLSLQHLNAIERPCKVIDAPPFFNYEESSLQLLWVICDLCHRTCNWHKYELHTCSIVGDAGTREGRQKKRDQDKEVSKQNQEFLPKVAPRSGDGYKTDI